MAESFRTKSVETLECPREEASTDDESNLLFNDSDEYDDSNEFQPFTAFSIKLGSDDIPRFSCTCHKCNVAIRCAIKSHQELTSVLSKLSRYAGTVKHSLNLILGHINNKAKLFIDNKTRWFSSYLMLLSFQKSYARGAFSSELDCPVTLRVIETYIQILTPAYQFNLIMQKSESTIGEIIPALLIMLSKWRRFRVGQPYRRLCDLLIKAFSRKFEYELGSTIYKVLILKLSNIYNLYCDKISIIRFLV